MSLDVLSAGWFARALELTSDLPAQPGVGCRLQFDAVGPDGTHERWHQVVVDGRITAWAPGELPDPDLELRLALDDARRTYQGELSGSEALAAVTVAYRQGDTVVTGPPAPLDVTVNDAYDDLPATPGATLTIQYHFSAGPFGPVDCWWAFDDGRSADLAFGVADEADVSVWIPYARMVAVRLGEMTILEALEHGGKVDGGVGPLVLLAGLHESPEMQAADRRCGPSGPVLAALGQVTDRPEHRRAMATLAAEAR